MSMYKQFQTNSGAEVSGIILDYDSFRITVAAAYQGSANKRFAKAVEAKTRHIRRALANEQVSPEQSAAVMREVYAEAVVLNWEVAKHDGESANTTWVQGIEGPNGDLLPFNKQNVIQAFAALPRLFVDVQEQTGKDLLFRQSVQEEAAKN